MTSVNNENIVSHEDESKNIFISIVFNLNIILAEEKMSQLKEIISQYESKFQKREMKMHKSKGTLCLSFSFYPTHELCAILKKIIDVIRKGASQNSGNVDIFSSTNLNIKIQKANYSQMQRVFNSLQIFLNTVTDFKFNCDCQINDKQLSLLVQILSMLRKVDKFEFVVKDKIAYTQELSNKLIEAIEKSTKNCTSFIYNNSIGESVGKSQGYSNPEVSRIPGMLSKIVSSMTNLKVVDLNCYPGWNPQYKQRAITSQFISGISTQLNQWSTSLTKIEINLNRVTCFNQNIGPQLIQNFIFEFTKLISKQQELQELSLNLSGIGCFGNYYSNQRFQGLGELTQQLKTVKRLTMELGGHLNLSEQEWNQFFLGISNIQKLTNLNLNVEFWRNFKSNEIDAKQQYRIIDTFMNNLVNNHKKSLQVLTFITDDWSFLSSVNQFNLLKKISDIKHLNTLKLLFTKTEMLEKYELIRLAQNYYEDLRSVIKTKPLLQTLAYLSQTQESITKSIVQEQINTIKDLKSIDICQKKDLIDSTNNRILNVIQNCSQTYQDFQQECIDNLIVSKFHSYSIKLQREKTSIQQTELVIPSVQQTSSYSEEANLERENTLSFEQQQFESYDQNDKYYYQNNDEYDYEAQEQAYNIFNYNQNQYQQQQPYFF